MPQSESRGCLLIVNSEDAQALADLFTAEGYEVETAAPERSDRFDTILVDSSSERSGAGICRELRAQQVTAPIMLLTKGSDTAEMILALRSGADDSMLRPFDTAELRARIEALMRRRRPQGRRDSCKVAFGDIAIDFSKGVLVKRGRLVHLARKEAQLLQYLIASRAAVCSREELLRDVWGNASFDTRTVDVHVATLRRKLEDDPEQPRHLVTFRGKGYVFQTAVKKSTAKPG